MIKIMCNLIIEKKHIESLWNQPENFIYNIVYYLSNKTGMCKITNKIGLLIIYVLLIYYLKTNNFES